MSSRSEACASGAGAVAGITDFSAHDAARKTSIAIMAIRNLNCTYFSEAFGRLRIVAIAESM